MVADEMQKRLVSDVITSAQQGLSVAVSLLLDNKRQAFDQLARGLAKGVLCTRAQDHCDRFDAGCSHLLDDHLEGGFFNAIPVD